VGLGRKAAIGVVLGAGLVLVAETVRPRGGQANLIDWAEIEALAANRIRGTRLAPATRRKLEADYRRLAADVTPALLETVGGLPPGASLPEFRALDRFSWLKLNVGLMRQALEPMEKSAVVPNSLLAQMGRAGLSQYVALLLGFLSGRVLGQFDPQILGREPLEHGLYLVEPNVASWQEQEDLPGEDLRRWLILHELTHAWQFAAHPWLREHLNDQLRQLVALAVGAREGEQGRPPSLGSLISLVTGVPGQLALVRRVQATMSLVEGYGNLGMNLVGRRLLSGFDELEDAYRRRSGQRSPLELLLWRVTGLELKLQQYRVGEAFARAVHERYGMATLNRAWETPDTLPRPEELRDPDRWYRRVVQGQEPGPRVAPAPA
jgi:coenzyme F420 biosynthesis associated uncharacterized protein